MTNQEFARNLDYSFSLLNQITITTDGSIEPKEITVEDIRRCKLSLLDLLKECEQRGWFQTELDELYKDSRDDYQYNWQYQNNQ